MIDSKKKLYISVVSLILFAIFVISTFSYAFFTANIFNDNSVNVVASMNGGGGGIFTASSSGDFNFNIDAFNFSAGAGQIGSATVQYVTSFFGQPSTCTYDLNFVNNGYYDNELKLSIYSNGILVADDYIQNLSSISQTIATNDSNGVNKTYAITAYLYSLDGVDQQHLITNVPSVSINVSNVDCR